MNLPEIVFGRCPICGGKGQDYESSDENLTSADIVRDGYGTGLALILFRGDYICEYCRHNIINREQSENEAEKDQRDQDFRAGAGFKSRVPSDERLSSYDP